MRNCYGRAPRRQWAGTLFIQADFPYDPQMPITRARIGVVAAFITHGLLYTSWTSRIPEIKADLGLSEGGLGLLLLAPPAGAIMAMPFTGALCARFGTKQVSRTLMAAYCLLLVAVGAGAGSVWTLGPALVLAGALVGAFDVAMNAQGATVEQTAGKPMMGSFHASWSLGAAAGAALGGVCAQFGVPLWLQLGTFGVILLAVAWPLTAPMIPDRANADGEREGRKSFRFELPLVLLGVVAFAGLLAEGAAADWTAVFLRDELDASAFVAGWGYGVFALAMFAGRMVSDVIVGRFGRGAAIAVCAAVGALGMSVGMIISEAADNQAAFIVGLAFLGLGLAVIVPTLFGAAGDGPGIAVVSAIGYAGWLLGPVIIGGIAEAVTLPVAMWTIPALTLLGGIAAPLGVRALAKQREKGREVGAGSVG